jgi:hypothetical protein
MRNFGVTGRVSSGAQPRPGLHNGADTRADLNSVFVDEADREFAVYAFLLAFIGFPSLFFGAVYLLLVS